MEKTDEDILESLEEAEQADRAEAEIAYEEEMANWKCDEMSKPTFQEWITEMSSRLNDN